MRFGVRGHRRWGGFPPWWRACPWGGCSVSTPITATRTPPPAGANARSVRFFRATEQGGLETLGEIPLQADGSFLAEVPANTLLGLETLDDAGRVVAHLPPSFWVRPGENRSCIGCHEPHNSCPENRRPLAVTQPAAQLAPPAPGLAQTPLVAR